MKKGYLYIALTALSFSTMEVAGKIIAKQINPFQLNFLRFLIGAIILLPFALKEVKTRNIHLGLKDWGFLAAVGFLNVVICMSFFQFGVLYGKASTAAVIFSTNPVFTIPFAYFILKEPFTKNTAISIVLCIIGILFILNPFAMSGSLKGFCFSVIAAITFSLYTVVGKLKMKQYGGMVINCFSFFIGDLMLLIMMLFAKVPVISGVNSHNIIPLLYLGIVVSGLGYLVFFRAMEETSTTTASIAFFIKPALAPIFSLIILKETIPMNTICGIVFIILGAFMTLAKTKQAVSKQDIAA